MTDVFENLRVFPTIDFWRFFWTCPGGPVEHVPEGKCYHLFFFLFWAKFWLNMTVSIGDFRIWKLRLTRIFCSTLKLSQVNPDLLLPDVETPFSD